MFLIDCWSAANLLAFVVCDDHRRKEVRMWVRRSRLVPDSPAWSLIHETHNEEAILVGSSISTDSHDRKVVGEERHS